VNIWLREKEVNHMAERDIILYAVGDIGPDRPDPGSIFRHVTGILQESDIAFCQLEVNLSLRGAGPLGKENARNPAIAAALKKAGFNVVSFAGNHCLETGQMHYDTISNLKAGLAVIGVAPYAETRRPAIIERKGTRIAFWPIIPWQKRVLGDINRPGCAPLGPGRCMSRSTCSSGMPCKRIPSLIEMT
jgi:poly-gamma-glutamate synthesis protein (capsule biosynthesis protein)